MTLVHSPAPWKLEDRGIKYIVSAPGNGYITRDVCRLDGSTMAAFEQRANAVLISLAPELLDLLERWVATPYDEYHQQGAMAQEASALIARARGTA